MSRADALWPRIGGYALRVGAHLVRRRALVGWILVLSTVVIDLLAHNRDLHEVALVLISVVLAYILLPDLGTDIDRAVSRSSIWLRNAQELGGIVEDDRLKLATQELLRSFLSPANAAAAWVFGCLPFVELEGHPGSLLEDFRYDIVLEHDAPRKFYLAETTLGAKRVLRVDGQGCWVSLARTTDALVGEYVQPGCLLRELVPVSADRWRQLIESNQLAATLRVERITFHGRVSAKGPDLVRFCFDGLPDHALQRETEVKCTFVLPQETRVFPVKMASYFCRGRSQLKFEIVQKVRSLDAYVSLAPLKPEDERSQNVSATVHETRATITVQTKPDALLWPGSGVVFVWSTR